MACNTSIPDCRIDLAAWRHTKLNIAASADNPTTPRLYTKEIFYLEQIIDRILLRRTDGKLPIRVRHEMVDEVERGALEACETEVTKLSPLV